MSGRHDLTATQACGVSERNPVRTLVWAPSHWILYCGVFCCVPGLLVSDVSNRSALILKVKQFKKNPGRRGSSAIARASNIAKRYLSVSVSGGFGTNDMSVPSQLCFAVA